MGLDIGTPAGVFEDCVMAVDTALLELVEYDHLNLSGELDSE